jgi:hypothetical protein|tara:strand:+ start:154 stop:384 length:231 start_codon:yes stop_codon:yes gene_type:complete
MYREPHLQRKSDECAEIWYKWYNLNYKEKDKEKAKEIRKKWCNCVTEFGEMVSEEVKTNPRYNTFQAGIKKPEPPR